MSCDWLEKQNLTPLSGVAFAQRMKILTLTADPVSSQRKNQGASPWQELLSILVDCTTVSLPVQTVQVMIC